MNILLDISKKQNKRTKTGCTRDTNTQQLRKETFQ